MLLLPKNDQGIIQLNYLALSNPSTTSHLMQTHHFFKFDYLIPFHLLRVIYHIKYGQNHLNWDILNGLNEIELLGVGISFS